MEPNDHITLTGLRAWGKHGVLDAEHVQAQEFVVDIDMEISTKLAAQTDDVGNTINYAEVAEAAVNVIEGEHCDLIETLAAKIADAVLAFTPLEVTVTVHKPHAPIPHQFADVAVSVHRFGLLGDNNEKFVVLGIGSNLENPADHVSQAIAELADLGLMVKTSKLYVTEPVLAKDQTEQPDYVNAIAVVHTGLPLWDVLTEIQRIEENHGRVRSERWGARTLDIDVIAARRPDGEEIFSTNPALRIPHPRAHQRRFVLQPWFSIDPEAKLNGIPIADLLMPLAGQRVKLMGR